MSNHGWVSLAKHVSERRICLLCSDLMKPAVKEFNPKLLYVLKLLGYVQDVIELTHLNNSSDLLLTVEAAVKPCVLIRMQEHFAFHLKKMLKLAKQGKCIVLFHANYIPFLRPKLLKLIPCLVWNLSRETNVKEAGFQYSFINKCWINKRQALFQTRKPLPVLLDAVDNICCKLYLRKSPNKLSKRKIAKRLQRVYRTKVLCAIIIQQAVKQWLYRPNAALGQQIVNRLYSYKK